MKKDNFIKRPLEVALVLNMKSHIEGQPTSYNLVKIILGNFDEESRTFIDLHGNRYYHITSSSGYEYGYCSRCDLQYIHEIYNKKTKKDSLREYAKEFRFSTFYFGASDNSLSNMFLICENYITHNQAYYEDYDIQLTPKVNLKKLNTKELINTVKKRVIGQDDAIDDIVTTLWQNSHSKKKKNMLLIGPTGVGKTEILRIISREIDVPLVIASSSALTKSGYKGDSVDDILRRLLYG